MIMIDKRAQTPTINPPRAAALSPDSSVFFIFTVNTTQNKTILKTSTDLTISVWTGTWAADSENRYTLDELTKEGGCGQALELVIVKTGTL